MKSRININVIVAVSITVLVIFHSIVYLYLNDYILRKFLTDPDPEKLVISAISKHKLDAYNDDWIKKMEEKYRQENERIRKICNEHRTEPLFDSANNDKIQKEIELKMSIMIDVKHLLAYCLNAKVASYF